MAKNQTVYVIKDYGTDITIKVFSTSEKAEAYINANPREMYTWDSFIVDGK